MCRFIETVRIENGQVYRACWHNRRMNATRHSFWEKDLPELDIVSAIGRTEGFTERTRCRVVYGKEIEEITFSSYTVRPVRSLRIVVDNTIDYAFKYADRSAVNRLFEQRYQQDDILIVKNGRVTDTSIGNIALLNGNQWFTPKYPLLKGTHRSELLANGTLQEKDLLLTDLSSYQQLCVFNAMLDFGEVIVDVREIRQ